MQIRSLVSIIIPVYNRAEIIKATLDSIIQQTYPNWECLLVDDGSTDSTLTTLEYYSKNDARFKIIKRPEHLVKGANTCRNYGFEKSTGAYVNWFDSDDIMAVTFLEEKVKAFKNGTDAVMHRNRYANYKLTRFRDSKFKFTSPENLFYHYAMDEIEIQTSCMMWKRQFLNDNDLFDESMERFQDNEFHIRMFALRPNIVVLNTVLATIRGGGGDSSQISAKLNLNKKKIFDILFYRYQTLRLNQSNSYGKEAVDYYVSKKVVWSFYDVLSFEKSLIHRFQDLKQNYHKLQFAYSNKAYTFIMVLKSNFYILYLLVFGGKFKS